MWILLAALSAAFAGLTSVLAKLGGQKIDSNVATALRTVVVLAMAWLMAAISGGVCTLGEVDFRSAVLLMLSGVTTGASWLCYYRALQLGEVGRVMAVDKFSAVLTPVLAFALLGEAFSAGSAAAMVLIALGTALMLRRPGAGGQGAKWLPYAIGSAVFASATALLGKLGIAGVESNLGTAIRTCVVLVMAWGMVFVTGKAGEVRTIGARAGTMLALSGVATGASWLCYYRALQLGPLSAVASIDRMSLLVAALLARVLLGERLGRREGVGLAVLTAGTVLMVLG